MSENNSNNTSQQRAIPVMSRGSGADQLRGHTDMLKGSSEARLEEEKLRVEAYLPDGQVAFSLVETAKILNRSIQWVRRKIVAGRLKAVMIGGTRRVIRTTIVEALTSGVEK
jgi:hypothetical protein